MSRLCRVERRGVTLLVLPPPPLDSLESTETSEENDDDNRCAMLFCVGP